MRHHGGLPRKGHGRLRGGRRNTGLLDGIKVLDAASFIAGPCAATMMADLGADVVKVEPPEGDSIRALVQQPGYPACAQNFPWIVDNRNKRGLVVDLKRAEGREVLHCLVRGVDVFITNAIPGTRARLGVRWQDLQPLNPRLIYASLTGYGETGTEVDKPGFDVTALWARSGLMDFVRPSPDVPPARTAPGMGDHPTGLALFGAIMAALYQRERTGVGTMVSTSLLANGVWMNATCVQAMLFGARFPLRPAREKASNALTNTFRCRDDRWIMLAVLAEDRDWPRFVAALDGADLAADARFATTAGRRAHAAALTARLDEVFAQKELADWRRILDAHGIVFGVVGTLDDIPHDRQMMDIGALVPFADGALGGALTVSSPLVIEGQPKSPPRPAPVLGEHTVTVLREAGFAEDHIARLLKDGVVAGPVR